MSEIECEEFYNLMQAYRHSPLSDQAGTVECYEAVKTYFLAILRDKEARIKELEWVLENLIEALEAVHGDPEYQCVWTLYQSHIPTGYQGRKYTKEFDRAKAALKE
jgi:hypothetical protein